MEVVSEQCTGDKCSATYSLTHWSRLLYSHHNKVSKYLGKLGVIGIVTVESIESKIRVTIPNLLKYRDEYSRKSGANQDKLPSKKEMENKEVQKEINPTTTRAENQLTLTFEERRPDLERLFPDINLDIAMAKLIAKKRAGPVLLDPYVTIIKWMQTEFKPAGAFDASGKRNSQRNNGGPAEANGCEGAGGFDDETVAFCNRYPHPADTS